MHDPLVVAFEIRRPWPRRAIGTFACARWEWHPPFVHLAGRGLYFPSLITVWHREPGGADALTVCKSWRFTPWRAGAPDRGGMFTGVRIPWKLHVHHWRIQVHALQSLRRTVLTRCAWCGGRSTPKDPCNISQQWDGPRGRWWQGEPGLFHHWCSSAERAWNTCTCARPDLGWSDYGVCGNCHRFRKWRIDPWEVAQAEMWRRQVPHGAHPVAADYASAVAIYQNAKAAGVAR